MDHSDLVLDVIKALNFGDTHTGRYYKDLMKTYLETTPEQYVDPSIREFYETVIARFEDEAEYQIRKEYATDFQVTKL